MSNKKKNNIRTLSEKYAIIKFFEDEPPTGAKTRTIKKFHISSISTLDGILKKKDEIKRIFNDGLVSKSRKSLKKGENHDIDQRVYDWVLWIRSKNIELSSVEIIEKRNQLSIGANQLQHLDGFVGFKDALI